MKLKKNAPVAEILKTDKIIYFDKEAKLSEAVSRFESSHDAELVVDNEQKLLGIITPYYTLIKHKYPGETKLKKCLYHPPKIYQETPLGETVRLMLESKVHYLPVINQKNQVLGIVTARRVLQQLLSVQEAGSAVANLLVRKPYLQTINVDSALDEALRFFERTKLSKLVVVDRQGDLKGVLSLFDLVRFLSSNKERIDSFNRGAKPSGRHLHRVNEFMKTYTLQVKPAKSLSQAIGLILNKSIGSLIVMSDRPRQPLNILTTTDFLRYFYL